MLEKEAEDNENQTEIDKENEEKALVSSLKEWLIQQRHIPSVKDEQLLYHFASSSKGNFEVACKKIDAYFTIRNLIPEFFKSRDPLDDQMKCCCECLCLGYLPGNTLDNSKVLAGALLDTNPEFFDVTQLLRRYYLCMDINFLTDHQPGQGIIFLLDCKGAGWRHMVKVHPGILRRSSLCLQSIYPIKLQGVIFINVNEFAKFTINNLIKPLFRPKLRKRIHVYNEDEFDKLYALMPKEMIPKDIGGEGPTYRQLNESAKEQLISKRDWLLTEGSVSTDESKRNGECPISAPGCSIM
ncbi:hypothetical protein O3M35_007978 [Rhynocoris fuscipes]|uniref:CRAL-TRIO domain-containing protein n=1 Tax=Rhynocoris fuscipes TaxID=488301 RepID=A0AAW1DB76_9HEMI